VNKKSGEGAGKRGAAQLRQCSRLPQGLHTPTIRWGVAVIVAALLVAASACRAPERDGSAVSASPAVTASIHSSGVGQLLPGCPAAARRPEQANTSAVALNKLVGGATSPYWMAGDIGASGVLSDGRIAWLFGDTVRAAGVQPRIVANSMVISSARCLSTLVPPDHGPVIPDAAPNVVRWPMSVAVLRRGDHDDLVVLCSRIRRDGFGTYDFTYLGSSSVLFEVPPGGVPVLRHTLELTPDDEDPYEINWGSAATVDGDWLYVYGTRRDREPLTFGRALYVARAPVATPADRRGWRFWDGHAWQPDHTRAESVLAAERGVSQTLSVHVVGGRFVAVSKRGGDLADFVYTWSSPGPTGPWTPRRALRAPFENDAKVLSYAPLGHPEIALASGRLLISISRNTSDFQRLADNPVIGRPLFAEVERP
jgi:hypothetical protein